MSLFCAISFVLICTKSAFADVATDSVVNKMVVVNSNSATPSFMTIEEYSNEVERAFNDVKYPDVCNLPTLYRQSTFHPYKDDMFGLDINSYPIYKVAVESNDESRKNKIGLTFDSAYINNFTYRILDILDEYNATATFFMTNEFMRDNMEHVEEIIRRGHEIGNHSTSHPDFNNISDFDVIREVMKCHNFLQNKLGVDMCLFRFPYGSFSPRTVSLLKNMGYYPIQWSFDSIDWKNIGLEYLVERFLIYEKSYMKEGNIILFHNGATFTPDFLPVFLNMLKDNGLKAVKVSDLIYKHDFHVKYGTQISNFSKATLSNIQKISSQSNIGS